MSDEHTTSGATDEAGSTPVIDKEEGRGKEARRGFLGSARRNLSEEEASSPAGRRWLIAEVERLDEECERHRVIQSDNVDLRVKVARFEEAKKKSTSLEILTFVTTSVGAAGLGAAPSYMTAQNLSGVGWVFVIGSSILLISGIVSKVIRL